MGNSSAAEKSFTQHLIDELKRRKDENSKYSLRKFAADLGVTPSFLSKLMQGKRTATEFTLKNLSSQLDLTAHQVENFSSQIFENKKKSKQGKKKELGKINKVEVSNFSPISEWYYTAILETMQLKNFVCSPQWISQNLKISFEEARAALGKLENYGYFIRDANGKCHVQSPQNSVKPHDRSSAELKRYQRQILLKSIEALEEVPIDLRVHSALTLSVSMDKLEAAKKLMQNFRHKMMRLMNSAEPGDHVYEVALSFFPITKLHSQKVSRK